MGLSKAQYSQIIAHVFAKHYKRGAKEVVFDREEIVEAAQKLVCLGPRTPEMLFILFDFEKHFQNRSRRLRLSALEWILRKAGASRYRFVLGKQWSSLLIRAHRSVIKIPDATPGVNREALH